METSLNSVSRNECGDTLDGECVNTLTFFQREGVLHYVVNVTTGPRVAIDARGDGEACSEGI